MKGQRVALCAAVTLCFVPHAALAQPDSILPSTVNSTAGCELHVWPGNDMRSIYSGWLHGGIVDGAINGRDGYPPLPKSPLPATRQIQQLQSMRLADLLGLSGYDTIIHSEPLESHIIRTSSARFTVASPACYAELAIDDVFFQEDIVTGRFIKVLFRFRQYDSGNTPNRSFGTYIQEKLLLFPPVTPQGTQASLDELAGAFGKAVAEFGAALTRPQKRLHKVIIEK